MQHLKLKTLMKTKFASKVIMFEEILKFKNVFILCYNRQKFVALQQKVPKAQMWAIVEIITFVLRCLHTMVTLYGHHNGNFFYIF
jgi:hypothetical protein